MSIAEVADQTEAPSTESALTLTDAERDRLLIEKLIAHLIEGKQHVVRDGQPGGFRNRMIGMLQSCPSIDAYTPESIDALEQMLEGIGAFDIRTERHQVLDIDDDAYDLTIMRATDAKVWPMGTHYWIRDAARVASILLQADRPLGKDLLLSATTIMSTSKQIERFRTVIQSSDPDYPNMHDSWPKIWTGIDDNLNAAKDEGWAQKQDAFQILAVNLLDALERGQITLDELTPKHREMLGSIVPFLAKVRFWEQENSGSWEELTAKRSSVMAWDVTIIDRLAQQSLQPGFEFLSREFEKHSLSLDREYHDRSFVDVASILVKKGAEVLKQRLPFESPDYERNDIRYREADGTLIYLLELDIPSFIAKKLDLDPAWAVEMENKILEQVESLHDPVTGGFHRYRGDRYQGQQYYRPTVRKELHWFFNPEKKENDEAKKDEPELPPDHTGARSFAGIQKIVPAGTEAAWTHFAFQLSAWAGRKWLNTRDEKYRTLQFTHFQNGMRMVTGEGEHSIDYHNPAYGIFQVPPGQFPECRITEVDEDGRPFSFPGPHVPLRWAQMEALKAFQAMKKTLATAPETAIAA